MAVAFSQLQNLGRLGNQLWQVAATIGYARKHDMDYILPKWKYAYAFKGRFNQAASSPAFLRYNEPNFHYNEIPAFREVDLYGYFQTEKYFKHCELEIRELFEPSDEIQKKINKEYGNILKKNTCAIHIRRDDYLKLSNYHTNLSMHYYNNAIAKMKSDWYLVFSDDIEWCKNKIHGDKVVYVNTEDDVLDFFIMSQCKKFVIANSSFSWWASYLSKHPDKEVIAPRKDQWFGKDAKVRSVDDLYLPNWKQGSLKPAVIIFHKNIKSYPNEWINKCVDSIRNQTYKNFDVFEIDYGGERNQIYSGSKFFNKKLKDHAEAHNYLLDEVFSMDYDCAFNVNVDDYYSPDRFEKQLEYIERGYDVVSSNFRRVSKDDHFLYNLNFSGKNIITESKREHNVIAHPVVCYSRKFWLNCDRLKSSEIPKDDFMLWKRSYEKDFKFIILPDYLLSQRIHNNNVSAKKQQPYERGRF